jgi:hypothetical protein
MNGNRGAAGWPRPVLPGPARAGGRLRSPATFGPTGHELAVRYRPLSTGRAYPLPFPPTRLPLREIPPTPTHWTWTSAATGLATAGQQAGGLHETVPRCPK